ncbi:MAG: LytTR family transcriptional regulator [Bacteroidetes bacterium]|nr:LytTR family transcriptional regulator [Bacteroidota bacterium]
MSLSEILYIESQREYIKIVTNKSEFISKMSTKDIEDILPDILFKRIHRSFIVAINKIDSYTAEAVEINGMHIPVGRGYRGIIDNM